MWTTRAMMLILVLSAGGCCDEPQPDCDTTAECRPAAAEAICPELGGCEPGAERWLCPHCIHPPTDQCTEIGVCDTHLMWCCPPSAVG